MVGEEEDDLSLRKRDLRRCKSYKISNKIGVDNNSSNPSEILVCLWYLAEIDKSIDHY